jgi:hypothetical protein
VDLDRVVELWDAEEDVEPFEDKDPDRAAEDRDTILSGNVDVLVSRATVRLKLRDYDGARRDLDLAVDRSPEGECYALEMRARFRTLMGEKREALEDLDIVIKKEPYDDHSLLRRARLRDKLGNPAGAREDREKVREMRARWAENSAKMQAYQEEKAAAAKKKKPKKKKKKKQSD